MQIYKYINNYYILISECIPGPGPLDRMGDSKKLGFAENFMLAGVAAGVSKTVAAP